jgi:hypothetical protein
MSDTYRTIDGEAWTLDLPFIRDENGLAVGDSEIFSELLRLAAHSRRLFDALDRMVNYARNLDRFLEAKQAAQQLLAELRPHVKPEPEEPEEEGRYDPDAPSVQERAERSYRDKYYGG